MDDLRSKMFAATVQFSAKNVEAIVKAMVDASDETSIVGDDGGDPRAVHSDRPVKRIRCDADSPATTAAAAAAVAVTE